MQEVTAFKEAGEWMPRRPQTPRRAARGGRHSAIPKLNELQQQLVKAVSICEPLSRASSKHAQSRAVRAPTFSRPSTPAPPALVRAAPRMRLPPTAAIATGNDFAASLDLAWEIDLFGRLRNAASAAGDRAQASAADLAAVDLALRAELATDYFSLRGADAELKLLETPCARSERAYELTSNRYKGGIAAATDVDQAETQRQNARAQHAPMRLQRAQFEHAIAVLLGQPPARFTLEAAPFVGEPPPISAPACLPRCCCGGRTSRAQSGP